MASATLTKAVKQLAMPVMGGSRFVVVDADREVSSQSNIPVKLTAAIQISKSKLQCPVIILSQIFDYISLTGGSLCGKCSRPC